METVTIVKEIFAGVLEDAGCETTAEKVEFFVFSLAAMVGVFSMIWVISAISWMFS